MIPKGLFSQLALIILSGLLIFTYIKPSLVRVKETEDRISLYQEQRMKVQAVNDKLATLKTAVDNVSETDQKNLLVYMPNTVDTIAVPRDIKFIADDAGVVLDEVRYIGAIKQSIGTETNDAVKNKPEEHVFEVSFKGSYQQIKKTLASFEKNVYPLEVHELHIEEQEGGFLKASLRLHTYNRYLPANT